MRLFAFHAKRKLWLFPVIGAMYLVLVFLQKHEAFSFYHQTAEQFPSLLVALLSAFILTSDTENEFAKCYGIPFTKLGLAHFLPHLLYPLILAFLSCPLYWMLRQNNVMDTRGYAVLLVSLFVTFFLVSAFALFCRIILRNMYATIGAFLIVFSPFYNLHANLLLKKLPITLAKYDIWVTGLLYSDKYDVSMETWLTNRLAYLAIAIFFFVASYLLLKQKNYENIH